MRHPEDRDAGPGEFEPTPQKQDQQQQQQQQDQQGTEESSRFAFLKRLPTRASLAEHLGAIQRGIPQLRQALRGRYTLVSMGLIIAVLTATFSILHVTHTTSSVVSAAVNSDRNAAERADRHARTAPTEAPAEVPTPSAIPEVVVEPVAEPVAAPAPPPPPAWVAPMTSYHITSRFEWRWGSFHDGYDFAGAPGSPDPILAVGAGTIETAWDCGDGYGIKVVINHGNGVKTLYGHLSAAIVSQGQHVEPGQQIGKQGSTGFSTGYHLHFGCFVNGQAVDPSVFMSERGVNVG